jgi:hypothetical protein
VRSTWGRLLAVMLGAAALGGCATQVTSAEPGAAIDPAKFKVDPCSAYSANALRAVLAAELTRQHWPAMMGTPPQSRISAHVERCVYRFGPKDARANGDQALGVFIYNELNNGAALMAACKQRTLTGAPTVQIGDESCVDDTGHWRFRVRDRYVSVLIEIPPRRVSGVDDLAEPDTASFVASSDPAARAGLGLPIALDLAQRVR